MLSELFTSNLWNDTKAASDYAPLSSGTYTMEAIKGELSQSKKRHTGL